MTDGSIWPQEIDVRKSDRLISILFGDDQRFELKAELLRVESPSAEVQGHVPSQKITVAGKSGVGIECLEPVGNYAVRIIFDDGHSTGIFTWDYLHDLGVRQDEIWQGYLDALEDQGLSR